MKKLVAVFLFLILFNLLMGRTWAVNPPINLTPTPTTIDYQLPYPGILPDHPLYFLKVLRDNILGWFINDPVKKVEFDLLMADKRVRMAEILFDNGKYDLSLTTASKAEKYLKEAIDQFVSVHNLQSAGMGNLYDRLFLAAFKHKEIITHLTSKATTRQDEWGQLVNLVEGDINILNKAK